jgi:uncharacterized protein YecE (DUF72 family)
VSELDHLWIGTSGWVYPHWRGVFYPQKLPASRWLPFYAEHFCTVEINNTFYRLPSEKAFRNWRTTVPPGFHFAVKANRFITHMKKLREPAETLERFLSRVRLLGDRLGPILYQLPPRWRCNLPRLRDFLAILPRDLSHVFEFRDPSWMNEDVFAALEEYGAALCVISHPTMSCPVRVTSDVVYVRMHGAQTLYASRYSEEELQWWAGRVRETLAGGRQVYVYFNNDAFGYAVQNARRLGELAGLPVSTTG